MCFVISDCLSILVCRNYFRFFTFLELLSRLTISAIASKKITTIRKPKEKYMVLAASIRENIAERASVAVKKGGIVLIKVILSSHRCSSAVLYFKLSFSPLY
jgi:hypothetical protein